MGSMVKGPLGDMVGGKEILVEISSAVLSDFKIFAHEKKCRLNIIP